MVGAGSLKPCRQACGGEVLFCLFNSVGAEVEDGGGEDGGGFAFVEHVHHVVEVASAAGGDDGDFDRLGNAASEFAVVAGEGSVCVHTGEEDLSCSERNCFLGPFDGVERGGVSSAVGIDAPGVSIALGVDGEHDALVAEFLGGFEDEIRIVDGGGVQGNFVRPGVEHFADVFHCAESSADGERHEALGGGAFDDVAHDLAFVGGGGDVEEDEFVGALLVVGFGGFDGVARVAELFELNAFDDAAGVDVEAGDDAFC